MLVRGQGLSHAHSVGTAFMHDIVFRLLIRDGAPARARADALIALATERDLLFWLGMAQMLRGAAVVEEALAAGDATALMDAIPQAQQGLAVYATLGAGLDKPACLAALAQGYLASGQAEAGLTIVEDALAEGRRSGQQYYEAEMHRLKGELLLALGAHNEAPAEVQFHTAIETARRQSAKLLELRAVMSLGRLLRTQGQQEEARQKLATIYGGFTEGCGSRDLTEARGLLDEWT
jgi:predicted ATPase